VTPRPSTGPRAAQLDAVLLDSSVVAASTVVGGACDDAPTIAVPSGVYPNVTGSGSRLETYEPTGCRKPTAKRFQPLIATIASVSATCSAGSNSPAIAS